MLDVSRQLGQLLVERKLVTEEELAAHSEAAEQAGVSLVSVIVEQSGVGRDEVLRIAADRLGLPYYDPARGPAPDPEALEIVSRELAVHLRVLPLKVDGVDLIAAMADPFEREALARIHKVSGFRVRPMLAPKPQLEERIREAYEVARKASVAELKPKPIAKVGERVGIEEPEYHINELLDLLLDAKGSDLHLAVGTAPQIRVNGALRHLEGYDRLLPETLRSMVYALMTGEQREAFENDLEIDFSHPVAGRGRFRVNVFWQRGSIGAVLRAIPDQVPSLDQLGMPTSIHQFATMSRGLVLVTGATGSGKSTTLASMIDLINQTRAVHVMTVEDPIEFMHRHNKAIVNQREVGSDTNGFAVALRQALRQDPDVILVGELRDLETMSTALTAAETGHLVFATLHTQSAPQSVERVIDVFPPHQQQQVRVQLASTLQGVITQQLLPTADGVGRVAAIEVLVATPAIRNLIREGKQHQIQSLMQSGGKHGMQTMDQALAVLVKSGRVAIGDATERAGDIQELLNLSGGRM